MRNKLRAQTGDIFDCRFHAAKDRTVWHITACPVRVRDVTYSTYCPARASHFEGVPVRTHRARRAPHERPRWDAAPASRRSFVSPPQSAHRAVIYREQVAGRDANTVPGLSMEAGDGNTVPGLSVGAGDGNTVTGLSVGARDGNTVPGLSVGAGDGNTIPGLSVGAGDGNTVPGLSMGAGDGNTIPGLSVGAGDGNTRLFTKVFAVHGFVFCFVMQHILEVDQCQGSQVSSLSKQLKKSV